MNYYIKVRHDTLFQPAIASLPDRLWRRFIECQLAAGATDEDGFLPPLDQLAWTLRSTEDELQRDLAALAAKGLVELRDYPLEPQRWYVGSFTTTQARHYSQKPDAVRQRRWRDEQKKEKKQKKENSNGNGEKDTYIDIDIEMSRDMSQKRHADVTGNLSFDLTARPGINTDEVHAAFCSWLRHKDDLGRPVTQQQGDAILDKLEQLGPTQAVTAIRHSIENGWQNVYLPKEEISINKPAPQSAVTRAATEYAALKQQFAARSSTSQ